MTAITVLTVIYQILTLFILVFIVWNLFESKSKNEKALAAMLIATFLLRVLLVK
ncbi:MAG: hypothetical protein PHW40_03850 [Candidatus Izemoplasmatales bacterium]|jgi:hypothetical protein|nr:hypothetical protein [Candidatus Izemoplasmatales bacterium]MDD5293430.1 hypothetical protein [Candidatus Izemoplasmatales bacterium]